MIKYVLSVCFACLAVFCSGQTADSLALLNLKKSIGELRDSDLLHHGILGVTVSDRSTGELLIGLNEDKLLPPASTMKLVTTAVALEILGEDFAFQTHLEYDGAITNGVLSGNLYITGTGDPTLGSSRFKELTDSATVFNAWLYAVRQAGIRQINGKIIADQSFFDDLGIEPSWQWGDVGNAYGAGISALNWNENACRIVFMPGMKTGDSARLVRIEPHLHNQPYVNRVETGPPGSGDKTVIVPSAVSNSLVIGGTVPRVRREYGVRGAIFNPGLQLATYFTELLRNQSISVGGTPAVWIPVDKPTARHRIHTHLSPSLPEICRQTNWWSVNLYAEALLKTLGKKLTGKTDFKSVAPAMASFWAVRGINIHGMFLKDGSGLSGTELMTPRCLSEILNAASQLKTFPVFFETIAIAGAAGTVRNRRFGTGSNIRAKSGSIEGTRAYAGYVKTKSGLNLSYVVNANRYLPDSANQMMRELMEIVRLIGEL